MKLEGRESSLRLQELETWDRETLTVLLQLLRVFCIRAMALLPAGAEQRRPKAECYSSLRSWDPGTHRQAKDGNPWLVVRVTPESLGRGWSP